LLGHGPSIEARGLRPGPVEIRLEATDTEGLKEIKQVRITLDGQSVAVRGDTAGTVLPSIEGYHQ
jgi:hypothetical protein